MTVDLKPTGERLMEVRYLDSPSAHAIYLMQDSSYARASRACAGKSVLDLGCGSGHDAARIAEAVTHIRAIDVSNEPVVFAKSRYAWRKLEFSVVRIGAALPFADVSFDVVVSFQVIEHVEDADSYLAEAVRLLAPDGQLLLITLDRRLWLLRMQRSWNRWHVREYDPLSLRAFVSRHFHVHDVLQMDAHPEVALVETGRYGLLTWVTLPSIFPGAPEIWRRGGLDLLHRQRAKPRISGRGTYKPEFDIDAIEIRAGFDIALNIVVVAGRRPAGSHMQPPPDATTHGVSSPDAGHRR